MIWWKKHTQLPSDSVVEMVTKEPEKFLISRKEILQLVKDYNVMKSKIATMGQCIDAYDKILNMDDEERFSNLDTMKQIRQLLES